MNLFENITNRNPQELLFKLHDIQVTVNDLLAIRRQHGGLIGSASGKPIALSLKSTSALAICILLFDGVCPKITLLPREVSEEVMQTILASSGSQAIVSDYLIADNCPVPLLSFAKSTGILPPFNYDSEWLLPTSGTTGTPKLISHTISSLTRTIKPANGKGASLCWGTLYDVGRFAGLQVLLQAILGGSTLALLDSLDMPLRESITRFQHMGVNALSATPTMWQKIIMTQGTECLELKQITLGGEIVNQRVLDALSARYPDARITHIYASTEFGVGFSVTDMREGFPADWLQGQYAIGRINPADGELVLRKGNTWFATGDVVEECNDRILFRGRLNGSINVGGNKVMPEEVERILLQYPGVLMASVSGQKNSFMGNLVQAEVLAHFDGSQQEFQKGLIAHCRQHLEPYKIPAFIKFVDEVSTSITGKTLRLGGSA